MKATDGDLFATLSYAITGGDQYHHFSISSTGQINTTATFPGSQIHRYELTVTVSDGFVQPRSSSAIVQVIDM